MTTLDPSVSNVYAVLNTVAQQQQINPLSVFICTNYIDKRLLFLMAQMSDEGKRFSKIQANNIADSLECFLNSLDPETKSYFIPGSGVYTLCCEESTMREVVNYLRNSAEFC